MEAQRGKTEPGGENSYKIYELYNVLATDEKVKEGSYELWYKGIKIVSGQYSNNAKIGLWKFNNLPVKYNHGATGKIEVQEEIYYQGYYSGNKKNGAWRYYKNKKPLCIIYYKDDVKDSLWKSFYESGNLRCVIYFKNGLKDSTSSIYYSNGKLQWSSTFKNGKKVGLQQHFGLNGKLLLSAVYSDGELDGDLIEYDTTGMILSHFVYRKGDLQNVLVLNAKDGTPLDPGNFKNGSGILKSYRKDNLLKEETYVDGKLNGPAKSFFSNGNIDEMGSYENGKRIGEWKAYNLKTKKLEALSYPDIETSSDTVLSPERDELSYYAEIMPQPQGGYDELQSYLESNVSYFELGNLTKKNYYSVYMPKPKVLESYVKLVVNSVGKIQSLQMGKMSDNRMLDQMQTAFRSMPPWVPGFNNGFPQDVYVLIPINFK
jgi:antitoxin component YwqK of YwqJK toxin-antitoxin module